MSISPISHCLSTLFPLARLPAYPACTEVFMQYFARNVTVPVFNVSPQCVFSTSVGSPPCPAQSAALYPGVAVYDWAACQAPPSPPPPRDRCSPGSVHGPRSPWLYDLLASLPPSLSAGFLLHCTANGPRFLFWPAEARVPACRVLFWCWFGVCKHDLGLLFNRVWVVAWLEVACSLC